VKLIGRRVARLRKIKPIGKTEEKVDTALLNRVDQSQRCMDSDLLEENANSQAQHL
jgi:hypothetical protein